jgi:SAM-dependent methyltransferase
MDPLNHDIMYRFMRQYLRRRRGQNVLDLGSYDINGTFRDIFSRYQYTGADIVQGPNVDVVLASPYNWQFKDEEFDIIISGSTIEHMEYPWLWFREMYRILKKDGLICIIAPAIFHLHRYPIDTYRYFPDGMTALAKWGGFTPVKIRLVRAPDGWRKFTYMVAKK